VTAPHCYENEVRYNRTNTKQCCDCERSEQKNFGFVPQIVTFWGYIVANEVKKISQWIWGQDGSLGPPCLLTCDMSIQSTMPCLKTLGFYLLIKSKVTLTSYQWRHIVAVTFYCYWENLWEFLNLHILFDLKWVSLIGFVVGSRVFPDVLHLHRWKSRRNANQLLAVRWVFGVLFVNVTEMAFLRETMDGWLEKIDQT